MFCTARTAISSCCAHLACAHLACASFRVCRQQDANASVVYTITPTRGNVEDRCFDLKLASGVAGSRLLPAWGLIDAAPTLTVLVVDNDEAGIEITKGSPNDYDNPALSFDIIELGSPKSLYVKLTTEPRFDVRVTITTTNQTTVQTDSAVKAGGCGAMRTAQLAGNRETIVFTSTDWKIAQIVCIQAVEDTLTDRTNETRVAPHPVTFSTESQDRMYAQDANQTFTLEAAYNPVGTTLTIPSTDFGVQGVGVDVTQTGSTATGTLLEALAGATNTIVVARTSGTFDTSNVVTVNGHANKPVPTAALEATPMCQIEPDGNDNYTIAAGLSSRVGNGVSPITKAAAELPANTPRWQEQIGVGLWKCYPMLSTDATEKWRGTFKLGVMARGVSGAGVITYTYPISYNATAYDVKRALESISFVGRVDVTHHVQGFPQPPRANSTQIFRGEQCGVDNFTRYNLLPTAAQPENHGVPGSFNWDNAKGEGKLRWKASFRPPCERKGYAELCDKPYPGYLPRLKLDYLDGDGPVAVSIEEYSRVKGFPMSNDHGTPGWFNHTNCTNMTRTVYHYGTDTTAYFSYTRTASIQFGWTIAFVGNNFYAADADKVAQRGWANVELMAVDDTKLTGFRRVVQTKELSRGRPIFYPHNVLKANVIDKDRAVQIERITAKDAGRAPGFGTGDQLVIKFAEDTNLPYVTVDSAALLVHDVSDFSTAAQHLVSKLGGLK